MTAFVCFYISRLDAKFSPSFKQHFDSFFCTQDFLLAAINEKMMRRDDVPTIEQNLDKLDFPPGPPRVAFREACKEWREKFRTDDNEPGPPFENGETRRFTLDSQPWQRGS